MAELVASAKRVMRVLLRHLDTGLFYRADGAWVESPLEATDFKTPERVHEVVSATGKGNLEVFAVDEKGRPKWGQRIDGELGAERGGL
jgi:hypothetical protein